MKKGILYIADPNEGGNGGGAGAGEAAFADGGGGEGEGHEQQRGEGGGGEGEGEPEVKQSFASPEAIAEALKKVGVGQQAAQPAKQYNQEDFDKAFHVVRPNEDQIKRMLAGGAEAVQTLTELLHAASKQAVVMSAYQIAELKEALGGQIAPLQAHITSVQEAKLREEFLKSNEDLKGFETIGEAVVEQMRAEGFKADTKEKAFAEVRNRVIKTIKTLPGFEQWKPGGKQQQAGTKTQMTTLSRGGGSGGAAASQGAGGKVQGTGMSRGSASNGAAVFD